MFIYMLLIYSTCDVDLVFHSKSSYIFLNSFPSISSSTMIIFKAKASTIDLESMWSPLSNKNGVFSNWCLQNFLLTLGDPLRMALENMVKGLSPQNTARELLDDLSILSSSLPVRYNSCFYSQDNGILAVATL